MADKKITSSIIPVIIAVIAMIVCVYNIIAHQRCRSSERESRLLQQSLLAADSIADDSAAIAAYKKLQPALPEIQLRVVQRQWRIALEMLSQMQRVRYHDALQNDVSVYSTQLKNHLDDMLDRCNSMLTERDVLRTDILWQVYNSAGSAKLLSAFLMLEADKNLDKVQGVIRDALTDYKAAIEAVDTTGAAPYQKNIPRWNFELLNGEQYIKKIEAAKTDLEKNQALKENLETLIPEMGGYAPGEPVETRIKK
jgi:hypothetical protein